MTKKKKEPVGRPTKYCKDTAQKLAVELTTNGIKDSCEAVGIDQRTYYTWLYKHEEFLQLSTQARKTKGIKHFNKCEDILDEVETQRHNPEYRSDLARLRLDFHLRLAGKANQGLFGEKVQVDDISDKEPVIMNVNLSKE